jgi:FkbM family methyltransferase
MAVGLRGAVKGKIERSYPGLLALWRTYRSARQFRNAAFARTPWGFSLAGNTQMSSGIFEPAETSFITKKLESCEAFVDIGANIGFFACLARSLGKKVIAVEPHPHNLDYLFANLLKNGWKDVEVFPVGLFDEPGIVSLYGSSTGASTVESWAGIPSTWKRQIAVSTLDNIIGQRFAGERIFIKMDVEGAEFKVLQGAAATLARTPKPVWLLEVNFSEHFPDGRNPNFQEVFELFWAAGYSARAVGSGESVSAEDVARWVSRGERDIEETNFAFQHPR